MLGGMPARPSVRPGLVTIHVNFAWACAPACRQACTASLQACAATRASIRLRGSRLPPSLPLSLSLFLTLTHNHKHLLIFTPARRRAQAAHSHTAARTQTHTLTLRMRTHTTHARAHVCCTCTAGGRRQVDPSLLAAYGAGGGRPSTKLTTRPTFGGRRGLLDIMTAASSK